MYELDSFSVFEPDLNLKEARRLVLLKKNG